MQQNRSTLSLKRSAISSFWHRIESLQVPIAFKWSISISGLIVLIMGMLSWFLVGQQEIAFERQSQLVGRMVVDQLARSTSEPLLADDEFTLKLLVTQQEKNPLIIGLQIYDPLGRRKAGSGLSPLEDFGVSGSKAFFEETLKEGLIWTAGDYQAEAYVSRIEYRDVHAGYAMISIDRGPFQRYQQTLANALLATTLGLVIIGVVLSVLLAHRMSQPIHRLLKIGEAIHGKGGGSTANGEVRGDEIGRILNVFRHLADDVAEKRKVKKAFFRYVSPSVAHKVLSTGSKGSSLGGATSNASVLFCDIVGFTELSENMPPNEVAELLNDYFQYFSLASNSCQGTVDKFIGDGIMILFGVPENDALHGLHALTCAVLIQEITERVSAKRAVTGLATVSVKVGINSGPVLAGNLGSEERMQYTVVGDAVNVASRLCDLCEPGKILMGEDTVDQEGVKQCAVLPRSAPLALKGRSQSMVSYEMSSSDFSQVEVIDEYLESILPLGMTT